MKLVGNETQLRVDLIIKTSMKSVLIFENHQTFLQNPLKNQVNLKTINQSTKPTETIKSKHQISLLSRYSLLVHEQGQQLIMELDWHKVLTKNKEIEDMTLMEARLSKLISIQLTSIHKRAETDFSLQLL